MLLISRDDAIEIRPVGEWVAGLVAAVPWRLLESRLLCKWPESADQATRQREYFDLDFSGA